MIGFVPHQVSNISGGVSLMGNEICCIVCCIAFVVCSSIPHLVKNNSLLVHATKTREWQPVFSLKNEYVLS